MYIYIWLRLFCLLKTVEQRFYQVEKEYWYILAWQGHTALPYRKGIRPCQRKDLAVFFLDVVHIGVLTMSKKNTANSLHG